MIVVNQKTNSKTRRCNMRGLKFSISFMSVIAVVVFALCGNARAGDSVWQGPSGQTSSWHTASNWNTGIEPTTLDNVYIANGGTAEITGTATGNIVRIGSGGEGHVLNSGGTLQCNNISDSFTVGNGTGHGSYRQTGGLLDLSNNNNDLKIGSGDASGLVEISGGTVNIGRSLLISGGTSGSSSFSISDGTVTVPSVIYAGHGPNTIGTYEQTGGSVTSPVANVDFYVPRSLAGCTGTVAISDGDLHISRTIHIGHAAGSSGTFTLSGGTVTLPGDSGLDVGRDGEGTYIQTGGSMNITNFDMFVPRNTGTGTVVISGGNLYVGRLMRIGYYAGGVGTFEVQGTNANITFAGLYGGMDTGEGTATLRFKLESGGVSPFVCANRACDIGNATTTVEIDTLPGFTAASGSTYDLITAPSAFGINTNGMQFLNSSDYDFSLSIVTEGLTKRLRATLNEVAPHPPKGTVIMIN